MRLVFAGTPPFAATALEALLAAGFEIPLVLSQPDRPSGRGLRLMPSAVSALAAERGLRLSRPASLRTPQAQAELREADADAMVVAAYGVILPQAVLDIPRQGCLNIHASLLPRWRGAAPVQRAILAGDDRTGVCIMRMEAGLDTGPVLLRRALPIGDRVTAGELTAHLASLGAEAIVEALHRLGELRPEPQDEAGATYAAKIAKSEARIDWNRPAAELARLVRAFNPSPGAETNVGDLVLKIWTAETAAAAGRPGEVVAADGTGIVVACGHGALRLVELQRAGARRMLARDFLAGTSLPPGTLLGTPAPVNP